MSEEVFHLCPLHPYFPSQTKQGNHLFCCQRHFQGIGNVHSLDVNP